MSLFNRAIRPPPSLSDDAIERYLAALHDEIEPDPLFRRRLRSSVVNSFVAAREGLAAPAEASFGRRQMGRLGRACLYASFGIAASAASVLGLSGEALPGEPLYELKLRIEQVRMEVVPDHLRGELAAMALGERIEEMGRLVESGRMGRAIAMAPAIEREYRRLGLLSETAEAAHAARIERHMLVLASVIERLPPPARTAVQSSLAGPDATSPAATDAPSGEGAPGGHGPGSGGPDADTPAEPTPTPRPDRTLRPEPTPAPAPTADHRPNPDHGPHASSTPQLEAEDATSD
jgi:hypothetical protein